MGKTAHDQREQDYFAMKHDNEHIKAQEKNIQRRAFSAVIRWCPKLCALTAALRDRLLQFDLGKTSQTKKVCETWQFKPFQGQQLLVRSKTRFKEFFNSLDCMA